MAQDKRVDFYLLSQDGQAAKLEYACRLIAKAWSGGYQSYVQVANAEQVRVLDEMLWTFADLSFIPHCAYAPDVDWLEYPVQIGVEPVQHEGVNLKLNLNMHARPSSADVSRVLELVGGDESEKQAARARFKFYRQQGIEPNTHKL